MTQVKKVGVVGLGAMGAPMTANLIDAGFAVIGYDIDDARLLAHQERGGLSAASAAEVAGRSEIMVTFCRASVPSMRWYGA